MDVQFNNSLCVYTHNYICINCKEKFPFKSAYPPEKTFKKCKIQISKPPNKPLNFTKALLKFIAVSIWKRELQYVNAEQYKERLEICDSCDYRHPEKPECNICKCKLRAIFNKAQLKTEKCPLGKWPIIYDTNLVQIPE